jgi:sigma-B regulation protein RsbU (phosphoserine phosphatase)
MRPRLRQFRAWLLRNGLYPKGKFAFITWYLLALDALLFVVRQVANIFHSSFGNSLSGWITFLSLLVIFFFTTLGARWLSSRLLWRLRNRLIVTYVFIGVIPSVLLITLALGGFYLSAGQFATFIATSRLDSELHSLETSNLVIAHRLAAELDAGQKPTWLEYANPNAWGQSHVCAWLDNKPLVNNSVVQIAPVPSAYPAPQFAQVVRDQRSFFLRAVTTVVTTKGRLTVVSSHPLDQLKLLQLGTDLGQVTLYEKNTQNNTRYPINTAGDVPPPQRTLDLDVPIGAADLSVMNWADGSVSSSASFSVETRLSKLYEHLFAALGELAASFKFILAVGVIVLGVFVAIAIYIGTGLTRSVTGAVAQLYQATTHVNRGDFSHRISITSNDQIAALAGSFNLMTESIEKLIVEQKQKQRLENEITIAQEVQAQLFPQHISQLPSLEVFGFCRPARSVSGDYYDFLTIGPEKLILAVGDVSGKGISAALLMATIHSAVRAYSIEGIPILRQAQAVAAGASLAEKYEPITPGAEASPGTLLSLLNHQLYHSTPMEKYATLFLAAYDGEDRRLTFSNAGHLPPMLLSKNGHIRRLEDGGTVVGLFDDISYDEGTVQLRPGDIFLAYSDGVTEPENEFGEFGEPRLIELVQENRDLPLNRIAEIVTAAVDDWIGAAEQPDDVTLVLARAR